MSKLRDRVPGAHSNLKQLPLMYLFLHEQGKSERGIDSNVSSKLNTIPFDVPLPREQLIVK